MHTVVNHSGFAEGVLRNKATRNAKLHLREQVFALLALSSKYQSILQLILIHVIHHNHTPKNTLYTAITVRIIMPFSKQSSKNQKFFFSCYAINFNF